MRKKRERRSKRESERDVSKGKKKKENRQIGPYLYVVSPPGRFAELPSCHGMKK
jgi:hypothetical protein